MLYLKIAGGSILFIIGAFMFFGCANMGTRPSENEKSDFQVSEQFDSTKGTFKNRRAAFLQKAEEEMDFWEILSKWLKGGEDTVPEHKLSEVQPDMDEFLKHSGELKTIWLGHSTFLLNMSGKIVLVDPVFSDYAAPVNLMVKRFQPAVIGLDQLPKVDYIVISHDHYDHLDMKSIKHFRTSEAQFIVPLGVGSHLKGWGIDKERIVERDWWQSAEMEGVTFTATPAQHFSGRGISDRNHTLWASWVIQSDSHSVYFSGDSGYDSHFKEIGDKYGPFDVAFIESGQYNEMWKTVHLSPEESVQAFKDLRAKKYFPVHWGMFKLAMHAWYEPIEKLYQYSKSENFELLAPRLGQIVVVDRAYPMMTWWKQRPSESNSSVRISTSAVTGKN